MDFLYTFLNAKLRFYVGDRLLHIELDTAYLVLPGACSRLAGHFYLSAGSNSTKLYQGWFNAPIHTECQTIEIIILSVLEAECAALFQNCAVVAGIWHTLEGLGYMQQCTEVITDNLTINNFVHSEMQVKRSESWDSEIELPKYNLIWTEKEATTTWRTVSRSIIHPNITN